MYRILFTKQADKMLRKMPRNTAQLIRKRLAQLAEDPYARNPNVARLQGRPGYRLRVGDWRVIYDIEDDRLIIFVLKIAARGGVYR
jgi:mRNA interferase RelE/StbE